MEEQTEVTLRCRECRRRWPGTMPAKLGLLLRTPQGRWQAYRMERSPVPRHAWQLGVKGRSELNVTTVLAADDQGYLPSTKVYPVMFSTDIRTVELSCRRCLRAPFPLRPARVGGRALAQGLSEVDV